MSGKLVQFGKSRCTLEGLTGRQLASRERCEKCPSASAGLIEPGYCFTTCAQRAKYQELARLVEVIDEALEGITDILQSDQDRTVVRDVTLIDAIWDNAEEMQDDLALIRNAIAVIDDPALRGKLNWWEA